MGRWQARLEYKQAFLGRIVDIGAELFAMAACCSRAEMLLQTAPEQGAAAYELAEAYCEQARIRVDGYFDQLWRNTDDVDHELSSNVLAGDYAWLEAGILDQSEGTGPWIADATRAPRRRRACTGSTAEACCRSTRLADVAVEVVPAPVDPQEAAVFALDSAFAVGTVMCCELDRPFGVQGSALARGQDVQPAPFNVRVQVQRGRPGVRVPRAQKVIAVKDNKGGVARTHELFRGGRVGVSTMEASAALGVLLSGQTGASA